MKKNLLVGAAALFSSFLYSQTYCTPSFASGCTYGDQIDSFQIPSVAFSHTDTVCSTGAYGDFTSQSINLNAGVNYPFQITHGFGDQIVKIWIDFDNNGTFTDAAPELVATASSILQGNDNITYGNLSIPATVTPGTYRMRVGDRYSTDPIPCNTDGYGEAHDYTVVVGAAPSCIAPTAPTVSAITASGATLSWTASSSAVGVGYEYYVSTSQTAPTNTTQATGSVTGSAVLTTPLSNLAPVTNYYVWVRSICTATTKSSWSVSTIFKTLCAVEVPNYTFDFTGGVTECWQRADAGTPAGTPSGNDSNWYEDGFLNNGYEGAMKVNLYSNAWVGRFDSWLITPAFNLSGGAYQVKFDYGLTQYNSTDPSSLGSDDLVQFVISQDGGTTWNVLQTWDASSAVSNTSTPYSFSLANYPGANTKFAFYATNGDVVDQNDTEFFIDNFTVENTTLSTSETNKIKDKIQAYPNPFADVLNITDISGVQTISVVDVSGKIIKSFNKPETRIYLAGLPSGMYMIVLQMKDGSKQTIKAIKK